MAKLTKEDDGILYEFALEKDRERALLIYLEKWPHLASRLASLDRELAIDQAIPKNQSIDADICDPGLENAIQEFLDCS